MGALFGHSQGRLGERDARSKLPGSLTDDTFIFGRLKPEKGARLSVCNSPVGCMRAELLGRIYNGWRDPKLCRRRLCHDEAG